MYIPLNHHRSLLLPPLAPPCLTTLQIVVAEVRFGQRRQHQSIPNKYQWLQSDLP